MFTRFCRNTSLALGLGVILCTCAARATDPEQRAAAIAPYLDEQTILVGHVDMRRIDVDAVVAMLGAIAASDAGEQEQLNTAALAAKAWLDGFRKSGGRDVYVAISVADMRPAGHRDAPEIPFFLVVPLDEGGDPDALKAAIPTKDAGDFPLQTVTRIPDDGPLVAGRNVTLDRLKTLRAGPRAQVAPLAEAFAAVDGSAAQVIFIPTDDHRRVIREMFPRLPKPLAAIDGPTLADGILWKAVGLNLPPSFEVRSVVKAMDAAAAAKLAAGWQQLLDFAVAEPKIRERVPQINDLASLLQPNIEGDCVVLTMKQETVEPIVKQMLLPALTAARATTQRTLRKNQFKHMALAMHNWAAAHGKRVDGNRRIAAFPPAAIHSKEGQPLLSWRVALLPFLEQQALYDQFHLDEPWDSPHNKTLIEKMPDVFKDQELATAFDRDRPPPGNTTYVVPVGEGLVFGRREATAFAEITDGTSQTIMIVELASDHSVPWVPWTKPADWEVDLNDPLKGVKRGDRDGFTTAHCDGSVRILSNDINPAQLRAELTRAGGEVVDR